jgi:hypothetical protein
MSPPFETLSVQTPSSLYRWSIKVRFMQRMEKLNASKEAAAVAGSLVSGP